MPLITLPSIQYLLNSSHLPEIKEQLKQFLNRKNGYTFNPKWYGFCLAARVGTVEDMIYQLQCLGCNTSVFEGMDPDSAFLIAVEFYLNFVQQNASDLSQCMRIPELEVVQHMATTDLLFSIVASSNKEWLFSAIRNGLINPHTLTNEYKETILHKLAEQGRWDSVLQFAQEYKLNLEAVNLYGTTPLNYLMTSGNLAMIERVMQQEGWTSLNLNPDRRGATPGHYVMASGVFSTVKKALDAGWIDPFAVDNEGNTIWHYAAFSGYPEHLADLLREYREKFKLDFIAMKNKYGESVVDQFTASGNTKGIYKVAALCGTTVGDLIDQAVAAGKKTILHRIAVNGNPDDLEQPEQEQFKLVRDGDGNTPCHDLTSSWNCGLRIPLQYNTAIKNHDNETALQFWQSICHRYFAGSIAVNFFYFYAQIIANMSQSMDYADLTENEMLELSIKMSLDGKPDKGKQKVEESEALPQEDKAYIRQWVQAFVDVLYVKSSLTNGELGYQEALKILTSNLADNNAKNPLMEEDEELKLALALSLTNQSFDKLSTELKSYIFSLLPPKQWFLAQGICREWRTTINDPKNMRVYLQSNISNILKDLAATNSTPQRNYEAFNQRLKSLLTPEELVNLLCYKGSALINLAKKSSYITQVIVGNLKKPKDASDEPTLAKICLLHDLGNMGGGAIDKLKLGYPDLENLLISSCKEDPNVLLLIITKYPGILAMKPQILDDIPLEKLNNLIEKIKEKLFKYTSDRSLTQDDVMPRLNLIIGLQKIQIKVNPTQEKKIQQECYSMRMEVFTASSKAIHDKIPYEVEQQEKQDEKIKYTQDQIKVYYEKCLSEKQNSPSSTSNTTLSDKPGMFKKPDGKNQDGNSGAGHNPRL